MFYKAGQLISANRAYIISTSLHGHSHISIIKLGNYIATNVVEMRSHIDAYVYHLKMGGNFKIVEAAQLYYQKMIILMVKSYIISLDNLTETIAGTFQYAKKI